MKIASVHPTRQGPNLIIEEYGSNEGSQESYISAPPSADREEDQNKEEVGAEVELRENADAQSSLGRKYQKTLLN